MKRNVGSHFLLNGPGNWTGGLTIVRGLGNSGPGKYGSGSNGLATGFAVE